jgi:putative ABC transport system ATP-binding protein
MSDPATQKQTHSASQTILQAIGLTKKYGEGPSAVHALRGVDLTLGRGELVVLLGPSGSGKSSLLNILGGLDTATGGQVILDGIDLGEMDVAALTRYRRDRVGFVFQFYNLIASLTAEENVALVTEIARDPLSPNDALKIVGLGPRAHHFPAELSGGEQQRVAIARAIAKRPELLLCDEPTGALDSETGVIVLEAIKTVNREVGSSTVLITHNAAIADMADRVISMRDGQIADEYTNKTRVAPRDINW